MNSSTRHGKIFDLVALGGFAQSRTARVLGHLLSGVGKQIEVGNAYLIFLRYTTSANCFSVVKLWEIRNSVAIAASCDDLVRVSKNIFEH